MEELVQQLVADFANNPSIRAKTLRDLADTNWGDFTTAAFAALTGDLESRGARYLVAMLLPGDTLAQAICDPVPFSIDQAVAITKLASAVDTQFDIQLARRLTASNDFEELEAERVLNVLERASGGRRLRPFLSQLLKHPSRRMRSKAALLIGRSNKNAEWAGEQQTDGDARVRANAVEALWGTDDPACAAFFHDAATDPNQRVAGNALVGLYKMHDPSSIRLLYSLANHAELAWQITAAWAMGETANPLFQTVLTRLMNAGEPKLRQHAIRALARIRKVTRASQLAGELKIALWPAGTTTEGRTKLLAMVTSSEKTTVPFLPPTEFLVLEAKEIATEYTVTERHAPAVLACGFAIPKSISLELSGLRACLERKRQSDKWCLQVYAPGMESPGSLAVGTAIQLQFLNEAAHLSKSLEESWQGEPISGGLAGATKDLMEGLLSASGSRHIICVGAAPDSQPADDEDWKAMIAKAQAGKITIHGIAPSENARPGFLEGLCRATGCPSGKAA